MTDHAAYGVIADRIESELTSLGAWRPAEDDPGPPDGAFGGSNQSFTQWIQFTLLPRVRGVAEGADPPPQSQVGTQAVRELDGNDAADGLVRVLLDLDDLVNYGEGSAAG